MFSRIFPKQFDNAYRGHWLGIGLFALAVLMKGAQAVASVVDTLEVVTTADGIPIGSYTAGGAETAIALTALIGFFLLVIALIGVVALIRYRAMIPFMFLVLLIVQVGGRVIQAVYPIARSAETSMGFAGHPIGFWVNLAILAMTIIGFVLSLQNRSESTR
jgi:hypothetical protein